MRPTNTLLVRIVARALAAAALLLVVCVGKAVEPPAASWATLLTGEPNGVIGPKILANPAGGFYLYSAGDRPLIKFNNDGSIAWEVKLEPGVNDVSEFVQLDILDNGDLIALVAAGPNARVFGQQFVSDGRWLVRLRSADASPVFVKDLGNCWLTAVRARPGGGYFVGGENWDVARIGADQLTIATNKVFVAQFTTGFDWAVTGEWTGFSDDIEAIRVTGSPDALKVWAVGNASRPFNFAGKSLTQAGAYLALLGTGGDIISARVAAPDQTVCGFELRPGGGAHLATRSQNGLIDLQRLDAAGAAVWQTVLDVNIAALTATDEVYATGTSGDNAATIAFDSFGSEKWRRNDSTRSKYTGSGIGLLSDGRLAVSGTTAPSGIWIDDFFLRDFGAIDKTYIAGYVATLETRPNAAPVFRVQPRDQKFAVRGETVTLRAQIYAPSGVALEWYKDGNVLPGQTASDLVLPNVKAADSGKYFLEAQNAVGLTRSTEVQVVVNDISVSVVAGTDAAGALDSPRSPIVLPDGSILVADTAKNVIKRVTSTGVATLAGSGQSGLANGAPLDAMFSSPYGLALETRYYGPIVYVADRGNNLLRRIHLASDTSAAISVDQIATDDSIVAPANVAILDGLPSVATATYASLGLWKITEGSVTSLPGSLPFGAIGGLAFDDRGNLYLSDAASNEIRTTSLDNQINTLASSLNAPTGIALDESANIYVAERGGHTIRKISPSGAKTLVAGSGLSGLQNGSASAATFNAPEGICFRDGSLIVADTGNHCLREIKFTPATSDVQGEFGVSIKLSASSVSFTVQAGGATIESTDAIRPGAQWQIEGTVPNGGALTLARPTSTRFYRAKLGP